MNGTDCKTTRRELLDGEERVTAGTARHLESCVDCSEFLGRFSELHAGLRAHRTQHMPDAGFASRVTAALPVRGEDREPMSWAAMRLLPAAVALALVLGAWCWLSTSSPASLADVAPTDDVLAWVLENGS